MEYVDVAGRKGGNRLFVVDQRQTRSINCNNVVLPFGRHFYRQHCEPDACDARLRAGAVRHRTVLKAQKSARRLQFELPASGTVRTRL